MSKTNARNKKIAYYATNKPGTYVEVAVLYTKGMNYFTYETYDGYKLAIQPMEMKYERGFCSSLYAMFSGLGLKVEPAPRFNAKRLAKIADLYETLPDFAPALAAVCAKHGLVLTGEKFSPEAVWSKLAGEASNAV